MAEKLEGREELIGLERRKCEEKRKGRKLSRRLEKERERRKKGSL